MQVTRNVRMVAVPEEEPMRPQQTNIYIVGQGEVMSIDSGEAIDKFKWMLRGYLAAIEKSEIAIAGITHHHWDHSGNLKDLNAVLKAKVTVPENAVPLLKGRLPDSGVDLLSDGRLELGIGAGWQSSDYERAGIGMDRPGLRIERLAEAITVLKGLFAEGPFDFAGDHYTISGLDGQPECIQKPHPPFIIAGGGRRVLSLAASEADIVGLNANMYAGVIDQRAGPSATPAATDEKLGWIREAAGGRFDVLELQTRVHIATITDDPESIANLMAPALGIDPEEALASPHVLAGSVGQCVETVLMWRERWGLSYIGISEDAMIEFAPVVEALAGV